MSGGGRDGSVSDDKARGGDMSDGRGGPYQDIVRLPRPEPKNHLRMSRQARAAQFAPFAALTGYEDAIEAVEEANRGDDYESIASMGSIDGDGDY